jgi:mRNA deadenylase 3'-5' endonuclease subunit Ccr4
MFIVYALSRFSFPEEGKDERYSYVPDEIMRWKYRWSVLQKELATYDADIFCLQVCWFGKLFCNHFQEVENQLYDADLLPFFADKGYCGIRQDKEIGGCIFFRKTRHLICCVQFN